jgi:suppressor of tumorigenicity protein 13
MQERMNDIADNQEAYENALASVLDKKQMKKWKKAKKHYQTDQRIKMEAQFGGMGGFGGGMPGGGFGGGMPGGGFGGGMPGGFGF